MVYSVRADGPKMQGLSFKYGERRNDWRTCFSCCHVRTVTVTLGIWHLMLHVVGLVLVAILLRSRNLALEMNADGNANVKPNAINYQQLNTCVVITFCTFIITFLMVYGAIKGKPSYILPFFCLQVFDFCISSLTALSYLCYLPDMHRLVKKTRFVPYQEELLDMSPQALSLVVLLIFSLTMLIKAYFIGVVWSCYKYLTLRAIANVRTLNLMEAQNTSLLPPQYEAQYEPAPQFDASRTPSPPEYKYPTPPPSYAAATSNPPPY